MIKIKDYKGYEIYYEECEQQFHAKLDSKYELFAPTQKALETKISNLLSSTMKTRNIQAYVSSGWDGYKVVTITSYTSDSEEVWYTDDKKNRRKESLKFLYKKSPENEALIIEISDANALITTAQNKVSALKQKLKKITVDDLKGDTSDDN